MKLNNNGWGLQMMMVFVLVLMICLVVVAALINRNFSYLVGDNEVAFDYTKLENELLDSTEKYIKNKNIVLNEGETHTVTLKKLQNENYISELRDNFSKCTGYSVVKNTGDKLLYNAYIRCGSNYKTKNYNSNLDN